MRYLDFRANVLNTLKSASDGGNYGEDLLYAAACGAIDAILPWVPNQKMFLAKMDGVTDRILLPKDAYRIEAIFDQKYGTVLERAVLSKFVVRTSVPPGTYASPADEGTMYQRTGNRVVYDWMEYPKGQIFLSQVPPLAYTFRVFYLAHFPKPLDALDELFEFDTPDEAALGMIYYAAAHCLAPGIVSAALIGQFKQKVDAGTPVDNALQVAANHFRKLFVDEMGRLPKYQGITA